MSAAISPFLGVAGEQRVVLQHRPLDSFVADLGRPCSARSQLTSAQ